MEIENFVIKGINNVNIVKSGDLYYCLNPENMEVEKLNGTAVEMLYLLNEGSNLGDMIRYFMDNYDVSEDDLKKYILDFFNNLSFRKSIINKLITTKIYYKLDWDN